MNLNLTWLDKFRYLNEIDPNIALKINDRKGFYLSSQIRIIDENGISSQIANSGTAQTPEKAISEYWSRAVDNLPIGAKLVLGLSDRVGFRWEGSRWLKV